jgi:hypothetical protein
MREKNQMIKCTAPLCLFGAFLALLAAGALPALAVSMDKSSQTKECKVMVGGEAIQISGYQQDSREPYCESFPSAGKIILAFDLPPRMRQLPVEVRIIKDQLIPLSAGADLGPLTEAYSAPAIHKTGTFSFEHDFAESGHFIALITVTEASGEKRTAQFKFSAGKTFLSLAPLALAGVVIGAALFFYWRYSPRQPKPSKMG